MFEQGQDNISEIWLSDDSSILAGKGKIKVAMESGQMAGVPWFVKYDEDGKLLSSWNSALCQGVIFK